MRSMGQWSGKELPLQRVNWKDKKAEVKEQQYPGGAVTLHPPDTNARLSPLQSSPRLNTVLPPPSSLAPCFLRPGRVFLTPAAGKG